MAIVRVELRQISATTSEAKAGNHHLLVDRPVAKGGTDQGPMGGELFLASVGGCFMSNLLAALRAREAAVSGIRTEVTGTLADTPARFVALDVRVTAESGDAEEFEKLVTIADRGCIMMNTLRDKLEIRIQIGQPQSSARM